MAGATLSDLAMARIVVVGDVIHDFWYYGHVDRISPEAPVPVFVEDSWTSSEGGAGNVTANLASLGITDDNNILVGNGRFKPPIKRRYVVGNQQIFRADNETIKPLSQMEEDAAYKLATASSNIGCLILSDYGKGMLTPSLCQRLIRWARMFDIPVVVDPKGDDWRKYRGCTVVTPNTAEWKACRFGACDHELITKGEHGMSLKLPNGHFIDIPAQAREVFDVTGAGDTVVAVLAACLAVKFDMETAARIANAAAGVVVGKRGTATCSLEELQAAYLSDQWKFEDRPSPFAMMKRDLLDQTNDMLGLTILEGEAEKHCIAMVRDKIAKLKPAGDISRWERGWAENLEAFKRTGDVAALRPKYIRDGQPLRLNGKFVIADDPDYEWHWYEKFREQIADRWLATIPNNPSILEFGCGSGHNVAWLAQRFPKATIYGFDWSQAAVDICEELHRREMDVAARKFDFFNPPAPPKYLWSTGVVLTVGALEQTGRDWGRFLQYLLATRPARVVHIEPMVEWYDETNPVDLTAIEAHHKRGFWTGYYKAITDLVADGNAVIEHTERTGFGSLMIEGYSQLIWRPL